MTDVIKKLRYLLKGYNPYPLYFFDLLTNRHIKNRVGECVDCIECCKHIGGGQCEHADIKTKRCKIYNKRTCDEWFPISQKELDFMTEIKPGFKCKFSFKKKLK